MDLDPSIKQNIRQQFKEFTALKDESLVESLLRESDYDLEAALLKYFSEEKVDVMEEPPNRLWIFSGLYSFVKELLLLPFKIATAFIKFVFVPAVPVKRNRKPNPFVKLYEERYSTAHSWFTGSFREVLYQCQLENKYLLVFSYKDDNQSDYFCKEFFNSPSVMDEVKDEFIYYGIIHESAEAKIVESTFYVAPSSIYICSVCNGHMSVLLHINLPIDSEMFLFQLNDIGKPITINNRDIVSKIKQDEDMLHKGNVEQEITESPLKIEKMKLLEMRKLQAKNHDEKDSADSFPIRISLPSGKFSIIKCCATDALQNLVDKVLNQVSDIDQPFLLTDPLTGKILFTIGDEEDALLMDIGINESVRLQINFIDYDLY